MAQLMEHIALVSEVNAITPSQLAKAAAALQKQVTRDFQTYWNVTATVSMFPQLEDVPIGYWPVIIRDDIGFPGAAGIHLDDGGQPYALVQYSNQWTLTTSHEILEMLADPFGNRLVAGDSPEEGQERVEFLVEVADPSEDAAFSYRVNGIMVSDFYTPSYFDPVVSTGTRYSLSDAIKKPREVLRGGYLSWHEPISDEWFQHTWFSGPKPKLVKLGKITGAKSLRSAIDTLTPLPMQIGKGLPAKNKLLAAAASSSDAMDESGKAKAASWKKQIAALKQQFAP